MGMMIRIGAAHGQDRDLRGGRLDPGEIERAGCPMMWNLHDVRVRCERLVKQSSQTLPLKVPRKEVGCRPAFKPRDDGKIVQRGT